MGLINIDEDEGYRVFNRFTQTLTKLNLGLLPTNYPDVNMLLKLINDISLFSDKWGKK